MVRPVSRRSPYNATFFAGGPSMRRKSSAAGRRFAAFGLGLSTIDGSPDLEAGAEVGERHGAVGGAKYGSGQYPHRYSVPMTVTNSSGRSWETATTTESISSEQSPARMQTQPEMSSARQPMSWRRSQIANQRLWSSEQDMVSRASSVYSGSLGDVSAPAESPSTAGTPRREEAAKIPIMERTRESYRLSATDKSPAHLRLNERLGAGAWAKRSTKAKDRGLVMGNAQRPISVDGAERGNGSLRAVFLKGDEAFI